MNAEDIGRQKQYEQDMATLGEMLEENKRLRDEIQNLKPLAQLAKVIALMDRTCERQHEQWRREDRDFEIVKMEHCKLRTRVDQLEDLMAELSAKRGSEFA
jgi:hypothetical protein